MKCERSCEVSQYDVSVLWIDVFVYFILLSSSQKNDVCSMARQLAVQKETCCEVSQVGRMTTFPGNVVMRLVSSYALMV